VAGLVEWSLPFQVVPTNRLKQRFRMGSVIKKRRKRMSKKKHRKLLRKTRVQRRKLKK
jgi:mRNA-processing protein COX24